MDRVGLGCDIVCQLSHTHHLLIHTHVCLPHNIPPSFIAPFPFLPTPSKISLPPSTLHVTLTHLIPRLSTFHPSHYPFSSSQINFGKSKKLKKKNCFGLALTLPPLPLLLHPLKMESNENQLSSYFHHQQQQTAAPATTSSPTNGLLPTTDASHMVFPHSVPSAVSSQLEPPKRKRGRPRKYGTPEQALAAKKAATSSSHSFNRDKKAHALGSRSALSSYTASSKKSQFSSLCQGFTPHVIAVAAGEDVGQKIMLFMQQSRREMCILSASGSISNASLRQPATSGGNIAYEGRFEIISLSGSYVRTELGGRTGGLSVCLSSTDGQIIGGGVGGPLKAAGPVQVIVGTFFLDAKKDAGASAGVKGDASGSKLASLVGESVSSLGYQPGIETSSGNPIRGNDDDHHAVGGSHFMIQQRDVHVTPSQPTEWWARPDSRNAGFEQMTGKTGHGAHQSPENGDYLT